MCFGGGSNSAAEDAERQRKKLEKQERERQANIKAGKGKIDTAFGQFDDSYYDAYKGDYTGYYFPQIDSQFGDATAKLTAALAGRGMLESTPGINAIGDLTETYNTQRTGIANEAQDAAQKLRANVENNKSDLYALNLSAADPEAANTLAQGRAASLAAPPATSPLTQVFAAALQPYLNYQSASQNRAGAPYQSRVTTASGSGSGRVVR